MSNQIVHIDTSQNPLSEESGDNTEPAPQSQFEIVSEEYSQKFDFSNEMSAEAGDFGFQDLKRGSNDHSYAPLAQADVNFIEDVYNSPDCLSLGLTSSQTEEVLKDVLFDDNGVTSAFLTSNSQSRSQDLAWDHILNSNEDSNYVVKEDDHKFITVEEEFKDQVPVLESWRGDLNFNVVPLEAVNPKLCLFAESVNKIFCCKGVLIPFKVTLDYDKCNVTEFSMSAMLAFTDTQFSEFPVLRCYNHLQCEQKLGGVNEEIAHHILQCKHPSAVYRQNASTKRCKVELDLESPQAGMEFVQRNFVFTCLSSCKTGDDAGIQRRAIAVIFTLYDKAQNVRGRAVFNIRVCSAPYRDLVKELGDPTVAQAKITLKRKPKVATPLDEVVSTKLPRRIIAPNVMIENKLEGFVTLREIQEIEQKFSSSQETTYSDDDMQEPSKIKLKTLMRDIRSVLKHKYSTCPIMRSKAKEIFGVLKLAKNVCDSSELVQQELKKRALPYCASDLGYQAD